MKHTETQSRGTSSRSEIDEESRCWNMDFEQASASSPGLSDVRYARLLIELIRLPLYYDDHTGQTEIYSLLLLCSTSGRFANSRTGSRMREGWY